MSKNHFFDVGANIGQTFDDFLLKQDRFNGWEVWCFEPSPRHVPALMEKAASVSSRFNVHICPFGVRGQAGGFTFFEKDDPRGDSFEHYLASDHLTQNVNRGFALHAFAVSINDFIISNTARDDRIVLKLDCEGSEYDLLSHLIGCPEAFARLSAVLVEFHTIKSGVRIYNRQAIEDLYRAAGMPIQQWMF